VILRTEGTVMSDSESNVFASAWEVLLRGEMERGATLAQSAETTYEQALENLQPDGGSAGYIFISAIRILVGRFAKGDELRAWYGTKFGV